MRWTAFGVALICAMMIAWHVVDAKARRELAAARAAFGAHGFPMRLEDIIPPPVPEGENADALLREAWRIASGAPDWRNSEASGIFIEIARSRFPPAATSAAASARFTPEVLARLQTLIDEPPCAAFDEAIAAAIRRRHWRPAIDDAPGLSGSDPAFQPARTMINLLLTIAEARASTPGGREAAWRELTAAQALANWLGEPPTMERLLSGKLCRNLAAESMVHVLGIAGTPDDPGGLIDRLLGATQNPTPQYEQALHAERLRLLDWVAQEFVERRSDWAKEVGSFARAPDWARWSLPWLTPVVSSLGRPRFATLLAEGYELHLECTRAVAQGGPAMFIRLDAIVAQAHTTENFLVREITANHGQFIRDLMEGCARERTLVVLLAARHHHDTTGEWPATVDRLDVPIAVTEDPCSGKPIRLIATADEVIVYALGFDGDDDGGRDFDPSASPDRDGDIAVRVRLQANRVE